MIEIIYDTEKEHIFDLRYELHKYIPESNFEKYPQNTELHFLQDLFDVNSHIQFIGKYPMIWSMHYIYKYMDKIFTLVLDEDYDLVNYAVDNPKDRKEIAEYICKLIVDKKI